MGKDLLLTAQEAAELADVKPSQLRVWLETDKFKPSSYIAPVSAPGTETTYYFTEADVKRLMEFAGTEKKRKPAKDDHFVDDGKQETDEQGRTFAVTALTQCAVAAARYRPAADRAHSRQPKAVHRAPAWRYAIGASR